jgi:Mrp family chromosome partitioning ATPase
LSSPVSSLLVGDRLVSRCDDGLLEAEYALFDRSEILLSPEVREEGYMTTAGFARARLYEGLVTGDLAFEAFSAMRGRHMRPLSRSSAVRDIVDQLGPFETFQGGTFLAGRGRYSGVWLDLDALAAACPLRDASILFQALHLVLVLEEVPEDAPVRLLTSRTGGERGTGGRTWRRVDLEPAQRLPRILREMQAPTRSHGAAHDEAEVREEILRDLRARATASAVAQPRLSTLAVAIARTSWTPPAGTLADLAPPTQRMSSHPSGTSASLRPSHGPPAGPATGPQDRVNLYSTVPQTPAVPRSKEHLRNVAQSLAALVERPPFVPDLAILAARAWLAAGEPGFAQQFARLVVDDASAADNLRVLALEILEGTPKIQAATNPPASETIQPARVIVLSGGEGRAAPPIARPVVSRVVEPPYTPVVAAVPTPPSFHVDDEPTVRTEPPPAQALALAAPQTALVVRTVKSAPPPNDRPMDDRPALDPRLVLLADPDSQRSASFRVLRDNLLAKKAPRIIAVSSSAMHEGKTTCAINLALALSEVPSMRVLLMEGNFFEPSLAKIFHIDPMIPPDPVVNHPLLLPYRIVRMKRDFHVAALVRQEGEPAPVFSGRWFDVVMHHLAMADYDHLVIDAAALDGSPAVTQLLGVADGTLLTARTHTTTARNLRRAVEQIPEGRGLGVILMDGDA